MPEFAPTVDQSTVASLERLLQNSDALLDAHLAQSAAVEQTAAASTPSVAAAREGGSVAAAARVRSPANAARVLGAVGLAADIGIQAARVPGFVEDVQSGAFQRSLAPTEENLQRLSANAYPETPQALMDLAAPIRNGLRDFAAPITCSLFGAGCDNATAEGIPYAGNQPLQPPFYGGQTPGVFYNVQMNLTRTRWYDGDQQSSPQSATIKGPVTGASVRITGGHWDLVVSNGLGETVIPAGGDAFSPYQGQFTNDSFTVSITSINRLDGQPDTGGNPAPGPGANRAPVIPPVVGNPLDGLRAPTLNQTATPTISPAPNPANPATQPNEEDNTARPGRANPSNPLIPANPPATTPANPISDFDPGLNERAPFIPMIPARVGTPTTPATGTQSAGTPTRTTTSTPQAPTCLYDGRNIKGDVVDANTKLTALNTLLESTVISKLNTIDAKLGEQIPGGGIGKVVSNIFNFSKKTWDFLQVDRVLSFLTFITVLHNAYMLSAGLTQTLFSAISTALDATGLDEFLGLVDSDDEEVNVSEIVGKLTDNFFKSIFGVENVDGFKKAWKKFNRIYQAATNMLYSIQSMVYSMVEILETISDYSGRIGNALKKSGVVLQNAFNWMNPNANYQNGKFFRYLNNIQEGIEVIDEMFSTVVDIQETASEFYDQTQEFNKAVEDAEKLVSDAETKNKNDSTRPNLTITRQDEQKAEEP